MNNISYRYFMLEATKITIFCLFVTGIFKFYGVSNRAILIIFNMSVMSAAATFSPTKKGLHHTILGSVVMIVSIVLGGLLGFYTPILSRFLSIIYAGLAFLLPKTKIKISIFVTGAVMFLIFSSLPFDLNDGVRYLIYGIIVIILFTVSTWIVNLKFHDSQQQPEDEKSDGNKMNAMVAVSSLSLAWLISYLLKSHSSMSHLYWIALTALVVIQGAQQKNIKMAVKRIIINFCGAMIIVILFNYIIPINFWINFLLLTMFLYLIFALGFSYIWRTLFIEMFVLGFTHLLGSYHDTIAIDRVILTIIGGGLVVLTTLLYRLTLRCE